MGLFIHYFYPPFCLFNFLFYYYEGKKGDKGSLLVNIHNKSPFIGAGASSTLTTTLWAYPYIIVIPLFAYLNSLLYYGEGKKGDKGSLLVNIFNKTAFTGAGASSTLTTKLWAYPYIIFIPLFAYLIFILLL